MSFIFYNRELLKKHSRWRWGEEKLGEVAIVVDSWEDLATSTATYVILGIPEDIGVRANYGNAGTSKAWGAFLDAFCNIQNNALTKALEVIILGEIDCRPEMMDAQQLQQDDPFFPTKIGSLIKAVDDKVTETVAKIVSLNKIPILIGGGHNNAYGAIKGTSIAFNKSIHCVNMDAHSDFRALEHRHSGNGFSYAFEESYLEKYFILGLHRNYTSQSIFDSINDQKEHIKYILFEDHIHGKITFNKALEQAKKHIADGPFGVELDLDAIVNIGSSAMTPSGYSLEQARAYLRYFAQHKNCAYIHLCEGAPQVELYSGQIGKTLSYLVSDIISK